MTDTLPYDKTDALSIYEYSKKLINHSLREMISSDKLYQRKGKGRLGQLIEELFFEYQINSNPTPDFEEAGIELKCTPLKTLKKGDLQIKERLVCNMINYTKVIKEQFEESYFFKKCTLMLLLFYLHQSKVKVYDLKFIYSVLWKFSEKDLLIIKQDYETIINKIKRGEAHLLSEGDTIYLGASRKGHKNQKGAKQPFSKEIAPQRAFALKQAYMRTVLQYIKGQKDNIAYNYNNSLQLPALVTSEDLKKSSFEKLIQRKYEPYKGLNYVEICKKLSIKENDNAKHKYFIISNAIAMGKKSSIDYSEEFQKSGIRLKTVRMEYSGEIKQAMSFENINYTEVYKTSNWLDSRLYEIFTGRFFFVIFKEKEPNSSLILENGKKEKEYILYKTFFWTMPYEDLKCAEAYWNNIKKNICNNAIELKYFYHIRDDRKFHVRPKGNIRYYKNATRNPNGGMADKYCYWFNKSYIKAIIERAE